ncbi:hypothetical protein NZK33_18445 [Cyanobium sp. FGCU-6]|nr:hypothetical protein [Cyanobium sp. FGCU6]
MIQLCGLESDQPADRESFEFTDPPSRRIYEKLTDKGANHEAVDYFKELTRSLDGCLNTIPTGISVRIHEVIALEVYSISQIDALKRRLTRLFDRSPTLDASTRRSFHRRLDDFVNKAKFNIGTHSICHFNDSAIIVRSHYFHSCTFSLELVGGYLVRIYIHFKPADRLLNRLTDIAEEQCHTKLKLRYGLLGLRRVVKHQVNFGNTRKRNDLLELDKTIAKEIDTILGAQILSGIYHGFFKGLPMVQILVYSADMSNKPSGQGLTSVNATNFFKFLLWPSADYQQTQYKSETNGVFVELRSRGKTSLESYAKCLSSSDNFFSCFDVLPIFTEKEALWLQASMLSEIESVFMRMIHDANISGQKQKRFEIYRLSSIYRIFSKGFDNRIFFKLTDPDRIPVAGFGIGIGNNKRVDYCENGINEIKSARKQIDEHLEPLLQACELAKDEASDSFQRWVQWFIVLLSIVAVPLAQIFWERMFNYYFPAKNPPSRIAN